MKALMPIIQDKNTQIMISITTKRNMDIYKQAKGN